MQRTVAYVLPLAGSEPLPVQTCCAAQGLAALIPPHIWAKLIAYCSQNKWRPKGTFSELKCRLTLLICVSVWLCRHRLRGIVSTTKMSTLRPDMACIYLVFLNTTLIWGLGPWG